MTFMEDRVDKLSADANLGDPSTPLDATPPAAPSPAPDDKQPAKDFAELALEALHQQHPELKPSVSSPAVSDQPPVDNPPAEGDIRKSNKTDEPPASPAADVPKVDDKKVEDDFSTLPFHKHERFQQLVKERNDYKTASEAARPQIERLSTIEQFMSSNRISPAQFKDVMEITALINSAPEQALERLTPILSHLQEFKGLVLPDDLKTEVDAGTLPLARAQEIAKLRKQSTFKEQQARQTSQEANAQLLMQTLQSFNDTIRRTDPDFGRKEKFVVNRFVALSASHPWQRPEEALALAKRAYEEVNAELTAFMPKAKPTKAIPMNGHSSVAKPAFTSWTQAEDMAVEFVRNGRRR